MTQQQSKVIAWMLSMREGRDNAFARNQELERLAEVQDLDLQHAASTIKSLCANAKAKSVEIAKLNKLIRDIYHAHFQNGAYLSYEAWMELLTSTRSDMERIAEEQEGQEHA